jgi:hypothetical protein
MLIKFIRGVFIIMIENILGFTYNYLEYIIGGLSGIGIIIFMKTKKNSNSSNDLTNLIIKQKKYNEMVNKKIK